MPAWRKRQLIPLSKETSAPSVWTGTVARIGLLAVLKWSRGNPFWSDNPSMSSALNQQVHELQSRLATPSKARRLRRVELSPLATSRLSQGSTFTAAGITAQYIPITSLEWYGYQWVGRSHYLALHSLRLAAVMLPHVILLPDAL